MAMPELPSSRNVAAKPDSLTPKFMAAVIAGMWLVHFIRNRDGAR